MAQANRKVRDNRKIFISRLPPIAGEDQGSANSAYHKKFGGVLSTVKKKNWNTGTQSKTSGV